MGCLNFLFKFHSFEEMETKNYLGNFLHSLRMIRKLFNGDVRTDYHFYFEDRRKHAKNKAVRGTQTYIS